MQRFEITLNILPSIYSPTATASLLTIFPLEILENRFPQILTFHVNSCIGQCLSLPDSLIYSSFYFIICPCWHIFDKPLFSIIEKSFSPLCLITVSPSYSDHVSLNTFVPLAPQHFPCIQKFNFQLFVAICPFEFNSWNSNCRWISSTPTFISIQLCTLVISNPPHCPLASFQLLLFFTLFDLPFVPYVIMNIDTTSFTPISVPLIDEILLQFLTVRVWLSWIICKKGGGTSSLLHDFTQLFLLS